MGADLPARALRVPCHFGEWIQGRLGPAGPLVLVTLVPQGAGLAARLRPAPRLACQAEGHGALSPALLARFAAALGGLPPGRVRLRLPYAPGLGTGMSTAALLAVAGLLAPGTPPARLARACLAAEGASDPLMFPAPDRLLWASRLGQGLGHLPPVPRAHLLAGFWGPPRPTCPGDQAYEDVSDLLQDWRQADGARDPGALARPAPVGALARPAPAGTLARPAPVGALARRAALAAESAARCLARRGPGDDPTPRLARDLGALGWTMSHSGAARALIFAPGTLPPGGPEACRAAGWRGLHHLATGTP